LYSPKQSASVRIAPSIVSAQRINQSIARNARKRSKRPEFASVPRAPPMRHMQVLMSQPVMQHPFAVVFAPVRSRFENRQGEQHDQAYSESDQTRDRFSVHGNLLSHAAVTS
jgi:hypothetical protein